MTKTREAADEFLALKRIAVTGVSATNPGAHGSNVVFKRLVDRGYETFAINPNSPSVDDTPTYPNLAAVPGGVEGVVIGTAPERAVGTMQEAIDLGITHVWMHRSFGKGSVSDEATTLGRANGVTVIDGGCPLMYGDTSDGGHRFMCKLFTMTGKVPRTV
jgi:uncharacterized protein